MLIMLVDMFLQFRQMMTPPDEPPLLAQRPAGDGDSVPDLSAYAFAG